MTLFKNTKLLAKKLVRRIIRKAKQITLPFFDGQPLYNVALFFWKGIYDGAITTRASAIAFNFILAMFPTIIFLFTLIPYIPIENFQTELMALIENVLPDSAFVAIEGTIQDIITQPRGGLLSFGFLMAFIFSTNGLVSIMVAFNGTIHAIETRGIVSLYAIAFGLSMILTTLTALSVGLITASNYVLSILLDKQLIPFETYYLVIGGKWLVILLLFFFAFAFLFYFAPARRRKFRFISAGGTLATVLSIIISVGFSFYINNFGKYNSLYGSIGTLVVVMLWFYFMALSLLIGFELNASIWSAQNKADADNAKVVAPSQDTKKPEN